MLREDPSNSFRDMTNREDGTRHLLEEEDLRMIDATNREANHTPRKEEEGDQSLKVEEHIAQWQR